MTVVRARDLSRRFDLPVRREGFGGSLKDLLKPRVRVVEAVRDVSFEIARGESVAYIGPNGAGKSTTVKMLAGILKTSGGELEVLGYQPHRDRRQYVEHIGVVFGQRSTLWWDVAVMESFRLLQRVYRIPDSVFKTRLALFDDVLGLSAFLATPARKLSLGQRVRADLAAALLHEPAIVFLDEPTIGLDVSVKARIRDFLRHMHRQLGTTLLLTTHDLGDVEAITDRVIVIDGGRLVFDGSIGQLRDEAGPGKRLVLVAPEGSLAALNEATRAFAVTWSDLGGGRYRATYDHRRVPTPALVERALAAVDAQDLELRDVDMESIVRELYERHARG